MNTQAKADSASSSAKYKLLDDIEMVDTQDEELTMPSSADIESQNLDGMLTNGSPEAKQQISGDYNHLDEPILDTLLRDLTSIYRKIKIVALPLSSYDIYKVVLRGWDLWGPLILCTFLAFELHHSVDRDNGSGPQFSDVFVLVWFGSCIVSLNYRLLSISSVNNKTDPFSAQKQIVSEPTLEQYSGGQNQSENSTNTKKGSSFNTLIAPPSILQLMCVFGYCLVSPCIGLILSKIFSFERLLFERIVVGLLFGFAWPTYCSVRILIRYQQPSKRALAIYPIGLFYLVLSSLIILNH